MATSEIETNGLPEATPILSTKESDTDITSTMSVITTEQDLKFKTAAQRLKLLGVTEEEMKRWNALKRLGLRLEDFDIGCELMSNNPAPENTKEEKLTGYTMAQIKRAKAVNVLGTTEEDVDNDRAMKLSSLGVQELGRTHSKEMA